MSRWPFDPMDVALGELAPPDQTGADALIAQDPAFAAAVARARQLVQQLQGLPEAAWAPPQPPPLDRERLPDVGRSVAAVPARRRRSALIAFPALGALIAVLLVFFLNNRGEDGPTPLRVQLQPVANARGSVTLTVAAREAALIAHDLPPTDVHHHYEAWVGDSTGAMVSMGTFRVDAHGDASVRMPVRVDLSKYSAVDISLESDDGNPAHSPISVFHAAL